MDYWFGWSGEIWHSKWLDVLVSDQLGLPLPISNRLHALVSDFILDGSTDGNLSVKLACDF